MTVDVATESVPFVWIKWLRDCCFRYEQHVVWDLSQSKASSRCGNTLPVKISSQIPTNDAQRGRCDYSPPPPPPTSSPKCNTGPPPERGRGPSGGGGPVLRDFPARAPASTRNTAAVPSDRSVTGPPGGGRAPRREVARPSGRGRGWPDRNRAGAPAEFPLPRRPTGRSASGRPRPRESLRRRQVAGRLAGARVQDVPDPLHAGVRDLPQVGPLRQVPGRQTVGVPVQAPLPRVVGRREEEVGRRRLRHLRVPANSLPLSAVIVWTLAPSPSGRSVIAPPAASALFPSTRWTGVNSGHLSTSDTTAPPFPPSITVSASRSPILAFAPTSFGRSGMSLRPGT